MDDNTLVRAVLWFALGAALALVWCYAR